VAADFISIIGTGAVAFVATNIDDIVVLVVFFSRSTFHNRSIVIGQYLGIGSLIKISAVGLLIALVLSSYIIGLMGLVPIVIGIKELLEIWNGRKLKEKDEAEEEEEISKLKLLQQSKKRGYHHHFSFSVHSLS
jgi:cadmium resistance protein CadD (predicted permease)